MSDVSRHPASECFQKLVNAKTVDEREENREYLLANFAPEDFLCMGISEFLMKGNQERLVFAASLIEEKASPEFFDALEDIVGLITQECPTCGKKQFGGE